MATRGARSVTLLDMLRHRKDLEPSRRIPDWFKLGVGRNKGRRGEILSAALSPSSVRPIVFSGVLHGSRVGEISNRLLKVRRSIGDLYRWVVLGVSGDVVHSAGVNLVFDLFSCRR